MSVSKGWVRSTRFFALELVEQRPQPLRRRLCASAISTQIITSERRIRASLSEPCPLRGEGRARGRFYRWVELSKSTTSPLAARPCRTAKPSARKVGSSLLTKKTASSPPSLTCWHHSPPGTQNVSNCSQSKRFSADDAVALAAEHGEDAVGVLAQRQQGLAAAHHLHEERHGLVHRPAGSGIDELDADPVIGAAVMVAEPGQHRLGLGPAINEHRRRGAGAAAMVEEARHQPAAAIGALRIIVRQLGALDPLGDHPAAVLLGVIVLEIGGVEDVDERHVEHAEIDRGVVGPVAVIVPGVVRRQHQIARPEGDTSPSTPVKLVAPVMPKRIALGECRCGGMISCGTLMR